MAATETLGKYEIRRTLGRGSAGIVLEGWDPSIQRRVAIKTVRIGDASDPETEEALGRFRREAQAAGRLIHPNIVTVHDYGETEEVAYIVMEFIEGPSLRALMERGQRFGLADIVRLMEDLLAGLAFSHERGIVHRDIKPGNVMLTSPELGKARAKIADFGIARIESSSLTQAGTIIGTPAYMSPEQFMGEPIDARSDIYAAGVLLYQLLTGERPFEGTISAIMHKVLSTEPPAPSRLSGGVPPAFDPVVRRAIAKRPEQRFASAEAFAAALTAAAASVLRPADSDLTIRASTIIAEPDAGGRLGGLRNAALGLGGLAVIAAGGGLAWYLSGGTVSPPPVPAAPRPVPRPPPVVMPVESPPPARVVVPALPPAEIKARVAALIGGLRCAMLTGGVEMGREVTISGIAGPGVEARLRADISALDPVLAVTWSASTAAAGFCGALDSLRAGVAPFGVDAPRLTVTLADDRMVLKDGDAIRPRLIMPPFAAYLRVDYIAQDGTVQHLYPQVADESHAVRGDPIRSFAPSEWVNLGDPQPGQRGWEASEPFGTDMIVAVASSSPLFTQPRSANAEPAEAYLRALEAAIAALRRDRGEVAAGAVLVDVTPR